MTPPVDDFAESGTSTMAEVQICRLLGFDLYRFELGFLCMSCVIALKGPRNFNVASFLVAS